MQVINKPWGREELIEVNKRYVIKRLFMEEGEQCSLQYHKEKWETLVVLTGLLTVACNGEIREMGPFESITIAPYQTHRMSAKHGNCSYLECSTPELDDVVRVEDQYGRGTGDQED